MRDFLLPPSVLSLPHVLLQAGITFLIEENESYFFLKRGRGKNNRHN